MKKGGKIALAILAIAAVGGGGYLYVKKRKSNLVDPEFPDPTLPPGENTLPAKNKTAPASVSLNYSSKFTKADKAHIMIMQKMIGVPADGAWGPKTEAALPKGLIRPFSLNELQQVLSAVSSTAKWDATKLADKIKVRLSYAMNNLFNASTKTKQVANPNGIVSTVPDWDYRLKVYKENIATMKANGISEEQLIIQYYNLFKRNLKNDFLNTGTRSFRGMGNTNLL